MSKNKKKFSMDRLIKLGFIAAVILAGVLIYLNQRGGRKLGWGTDLDWALRAARKSKRSVLIYFTSNPRSATGEWNIGGTLRKGAQTIEELKLFCVEVKLPVSLDNDLARKYRITKLPTMVLLDPYGKELNRRVGKVGQMEFQTDFLKCRKVIKPE